MIIALFPLGVFILSAINVKVTPVSTILYEISSSLNDYPISELNYSRSCTNTQYNGYLFNFQGHVEGCTCVGQKYYYYDQSGEDEVNPGTCSRNQTLNGCTQIPEFQGKRLESWRKGKFCSKKYEIDENSLKGYLKFLNNSVLENEECQKGYKKCGKLDDMGNYLCLPENEECPINDIIFSDHRREDLENLNYTYTNLGNKYFYYTNSSKDKPVISKLKVVEGKLCVDRSYFYTEYPQYILDYNFAKYGCRNKIDGQLYEKNINEIDSMTKNEFYEGSDLSLYNKFGDYIYDYPFYSLEAKMILYPQRYIGYDKKCLMKSGTLDIENSAFSEKKVDEMSSILIDAIYVNKFEIWFSIISFVIELFSSCLLNIVNEYNFNRIFKWCLVNIFCYIGMSIPIFINFSKMKKYTEFPVCGNNLINTKLNFYNSTGRTLKTTTIVALIFVNSQILFMLIILILRCFFECRNINENNKLLMSKNIDFPNKPPEDPYYTSSDFNPNNNYVPPSGVDNYAQKNSN